MRINNLILVIAVAVATAGCSKYAYVSLNYPQPPVTALPEDVHSIAVVNRSLTAEEDKEGKVIEAILTGEVAGPDRLASDACVLGVYDAIRALEGTELVIPATLRMQGSGTRTMPELLDWDLVKEICEKEGADALLVLETFDSNSDLLLSVAREQASALLHTGSLKPPGPKQVHVNVESNWRLYDPASERIIDQYRHQSYMTFNTSAGILPPHALPDAAYDAGRSYFQRYLPSYYKVRRELYKRTGGSARRQFVAGYRRAEVANWPGAMELWEGLTEHPKRKTAGRASLNMAVGNEVLGNSGAALDWAQRSYEFYRDKLGRDYAKILLNRRNIEGY